MVFLLQFTALPSKTESKNGFFDCSKKIKSTKKGLDSIYRKNFSRSEK